MVVLSIGAVALIVLVAKGISVFWTKRRSGPDNNWSNEAYLTRSRRGSWPESERVHETPGVETLS